LFIKLRLENVMKEYKYVIIGGGMTADAAVKGIREIDSTGTLCMISTEPDPPYSRPPLSKGLWKNTPEEKIWKHTEDLNIELKLSSLVTSVNTAKKTVTLNSGDELVYGKLLMATGGTPRTLPFEESNVIYYRTYRDYRKLKDISDSGKDFVVIGGGFIGTEIAAALAMNGRNVTMVFPGSLIGEMVFPPDLAEYATEYYRNKNVNIVGGESAAGIDSKNGKYELRTEKGKSIIADAVIAGIGIKPNTELAETCGIKTDNGITVNEFLQANCPGIYSAGDCANFYNPLLGKRMRVEHEDNANKMGKHAGRNMAGESKPYDYLPFFYSDMFELGYEAIGEIDPQMETYSDWKDKFKEGVVYYLKDGRVRGVLLWNVWGQVDEARKLIAEPGPFTPENLKGKLPVKKSS
jgi:3-phenylpropionate/trans-cinnamate dioxygenase ferredoxin reductase component